MKIISSRFLTMVLFLLVGVGVFAQSGPPPPGIPPPPGLPIDESLLFLFVAGLLFGIYIIYRYTLKTKTPV
ncbi:hypothetical protein OIU83_21455 [Flavobacterium sp. LS1R49]|uniref:Uncharacterized protein n=1 Tax=Flavobacterium shii TaxID=2987687 RepID=A0A9X3C5F3_9FLAO|nr:hypothetical protein [Flavobacterium shii]MCV9930239.1 hypothetical protein [Flavobacterium shii]